MLNISFKASNCYVSMYVNPCQKLLSKYMNHVRLRFNALACDGMVLLALEEATFGTVCLPPPRSLGWPLVSSYLKYILVKSRRNYFSYMDLFVITRIADHLADQFGHLPKTRGFFATRKQMKHCQNYMLNLFLLPLGLRCPTRRCLACCLNRF